MESNATPNPAAEGDHEEGDREDSPPRQLPQTEAAAYGDDVPLEEESLSWFDPDKWYPVRIGEIIHSRYQVLVKLGFASVSTVWLCRDLQRHIYVALKVYETGRRQGANESKVLHHLGSLTGNEAGRNLVRTFQDSFEIPGTIGPHVCLVYKPLCMSLEDLRLYAGGKLPPDLLKPLIRSLLPGLNYLHTVARVVHTDLQPGNVMLSTDNPQVWEELVEEEWETPAPRKIVGNRIIYESRDLDIPDDGEPVICDFGEAKVGDGPFIGEVMPDLYRAPEIILCIPWTEKIDIWSLGLMIWDLFEGKHLFNKRLPSREATRAAHLARIVSLVGKPPEDILGRSVYSEDFFDDDGNLKVQPEGVAGGSLEEEEAVLEGDEKQKFLSLIKKTLQWKPEDRPTAHELMSDPWLNS